MNLALSGARGLLPPLCRVLHPAVCCFWDPVPSFGRIQRTGAASTHLSHSWGLSVVFGVLARGISANTAGSPAPGLAASAPSLSPGCLQPASSRGEVGHQATSPGAGFGTGELRRGLGSSGSKPRASAGWGRLEQMSGRQQQALSQRLLEQRRSEPSIMEEEFLLPSEPRK